MTNDEYEALVQAVCRNDDFRLQVTESMVEVKAGMYAAYSELISEWHVMDVDAIVEALGRVEFGLAWLRLLLLPFGGCTRGHILDQSATRLRQAVLTVDDEEIS